MTILLEQHILSQWRIERPIIWQEKLINEKELSRLASERGLGFSVFGDDVKHLWQLGLLRADLIISEVPLQVEGLILLKESVPEKINYKGTIFDWANENDEQEIECEEYIYADNRINLKWDEGVIGAINELPAFPKTVNLLFHPFRYYVLNRIEEKFKVHVNPTMLLRSPQTYIIWLETVTDILKKWSSGVDFSEKIKHWNDIVTLAIGAEPFTFNRLFGYYSFPYNLDEEAFRLMVDTYYQDCKQVFENIGLNTIKEMVDEIGQDADMFEPNSRVYALLRLSKRKYRLEKIKGKLGGLMYLMAIAETLRRAAEIVFEVELPEEDEIGFGLYPNGYKQRVYGAPRIFDGDESIKNNFVRDFGLDYTIRLRWYVEGETELGALESALCDYKQIQFENLRGQVVAKGGKGLAFRDSLRNDMSSQIYSWVSLDGDRGDYVSPLKKAAKDQEMFGRFFISDPDFEFGNFNREELVEILWKIAKDNGAAPDDKEKLLSATKDSNSGKDLFNAAKKVIPVLQQADKGKTWGKALMSYALENRNIEKPDGTRMTRLIIQAVYSAIHDIDTNYSLGFAEKRVDQETGKIIDRIPKETEDGNSKH